MKERITKSCRPLRGLDGIGYAIHLGFRATALHPRLYSVARIRGLDGITPYTWGSALPRYIRVAGDPASVIAAIRKETYALDKSVPVYGVISMSENFAKVTSRYRYSAWLMGAFAALALLLSAIGIYGVVNYAVSARTHEIGVRIALGAQAADIARMIIAGGIALISAGMLVGLFAAFLSTRVLKSQLYGVETTDPLTFLAVSLALAVVALLACYIPARRATSVDPMVALRCE